MGSSATAGRLFQYIIVRLLHESQLALLLQERMCEQFVERLLTGSDLDGSRELPDH